MKIDLTPVKLSPTMFTISSNSASDTLVLLEGVVISVIVGGPNELNSSSQLSLYVTTSEHEVTNIDIKNSNRYFFI
jgi:hypothetical protein